MLNIGCSTYWIWATTVIILLLTGISRKNQLITNCNVWSNKNFTMFCMCSTLQLIDNLDQGVFLPIQACSSPPNNLHALYVVAT